jgi:hypothetical protein
MIPKTCLRAIVIAILMVTATFVVLTGEARAEAPATPHVTLCNAPSASIISITSKEYTATLKGNASAGTGTPTCTIFVEVSWGDGFVSIETTFPFTDHHTYYTTGTFTVKINASQTDLQYAVAAGSVVIHGTPYSVNLAFDKAYHLPGDSATLFVKVDNTTTGAPQYGLQSFFITSCYVSTNSLTNPCSPVSTLNSHPATVANISSYAFTVPPDADPGSTLTVTVEANETFDGQLISVNGTRTLSMASPVAPDLCVGSTVSTSGAVCAPGVGAFLPGQSFITTVTALVDTASGDAAWPNATVAMAFYLNGNPVHPKNLPTTVSLMTNSLGIASTVVNTAGLGTGDLNISVGITDSNNPSISSESRWMFVTLEPTPAVQVQVTLGASEYYGGDSLSAKYAVTTLSGGVPSGWGANSYLIIGIAPGDSCTYESIGTNGYQVLVSATGVTGTQGSIPSYAIPTAFQGTVDVAVFANNATDTAVGQTCALVTPATILIQPSEAEYNPGDTIAVTITPEGSILNGATYYADVTGSSTSGTAVIFNESLGTATSFSFTIPSAGTLPSYTLTVVATTTTGLIVAGQDLTLEEHSGYAIEVSVNTASQYSDGSFQPGQSITFSYTITPLGTSQTPTIFTLEAYFENSAQTYTVINEQSASGSLSMTLPSSLGTGIALVAFDAVIPTPPSGTTSATTAVGILVNPSPSFLDYKPFGSSFGMTMGQIILIIILVVLALLALIMWRRRGGGGAYTAKPRRRLFHRKEGVGQWSQQPSDQPAQAPATGFYTPPEGGQAPPPAPPPDNSWSPPPMPPAQETQVDYPAPPPPQS